MLTIAIMKQLGPTLLWTSQTVEAYRLLVFNMRPVQ